MSVFENNPQYLSDTIEFDDSDTCTQSELEQYFKHKCKIYDETEVDCDDNYVLSLAKDDSFTCLAAGLSDGSVRLFDINSERGLYIKAPRVSNNERLPGICGVRFLDETPNMLLVGTTNNLVRLLDLRIQSEVGRVKYEPKDSRKLVCFDRNSNGQLLCMGTEAYREKPRILFYDLRKFNTLYRFVVSHQNDITTLRFHPRIRKLLCSGSRDGLINTFFVMRNESDALFTTVNINNSVYNINWHKGSSDEDLISCITYTNDFKLYEFNGDMLAEFDRLTITKKIRRRSEANCTLINCHNKGNDIFLLTGSNLNEGEIMRSLIVKDGNLLPFANFEGNNQIVRESVFDAKSNVLVTGGERGIVTLWTPISCDTSNTTSNSSSLKIKTKKSNKFKPY